MMFNLLMAIGGLLLAGDSIGRFFRSSNPAYSVLILGIAELFAGIYFLIAAVGAANGVGL